MSCNCCSQIAQFSHFLNNLLIYLACLLSYFLLLCCQERVSKQFCCFEVTELSTSKFYASNLTSLFIALCSFYIKISLAIYVIALLVYQCLLLYTCKDNTSAPWPNKIYSTCRIIDVYITNPLLEIALHICCRWINTVVFFKRFPTGALEKSWPNNDQWRLVCSKHRNHSG